MTPRNLCAPARLLSLSFVPVAIAAFAGLWAAPSARAGLLAYEGFDYAAGSQLFALNGGSGWATTWSATSAAVATNVATGLNYQGLATAGGGVVMGNPLGSTATTASSQRLLPGTLGGLAASS